MQDHKAEIKKKIYAGNIDKVIEIVQISDDMAIIIYDERFWKPNERMYGVAVKDGKAYGDGWQVSSTVYHSYDSAILGALGNKHDGLNSRFSFFAERMLRIQEDENE